MNTLTVREKKRIFNQMKVVFLNTCVRCEGRSNLVNVERDHIIPTYQGGLDIPSNWQPLCAKCNSSKGPETIDWRLIFAKKRNITIPNKWLPNNEHLILEV
jgi:5-methylcytosine-specific restriction endonuclease McrA